MEHDENLLVGFVLGGTLLVLTLVTIFILVTFCRSNSSLGVTFVCPSVDAVDVPTPDDTIMAPHPRTSSTSKTLCPLLTSLCRLLSKNKARSGETTDVMSFATADSNGRNSPISEKPCHVMSSYCTTYGVSTPEMCRSSSVTPRLCPGHYNRSSVGLSDKRSFSDFVEKRSTFIIERPSSVKAGHRLQYGLAEDVEVLDVTAATSSVESLALEEAQEADHLSQRARGGNFNKAESIGKSSNVKNNDEGFPEEIRDVTSGEKVTDAREFSEVPVRDYRELKIHVTDEKSGGGDLLRSSTKSPCPFDASICLHTIDTLLAQNNSRYQQGCPFKQLQSTARDTFNNEVIPSQASGFDKNASSKINASLKYCGGKNHPGDDVNISRWTSRFNKATSENNSSLKYYNRKNHPGDDLNISRWTLGHHLTHGLSVDQEVKSTVQISMHPAGSFPNHTKSSTYPNQIPSEHQIYGFGFGDRRNIVKRENIFKYSCHLNGENHEEESFEERMHRDRNGESGHLWKKTCLDVRADSMRINARSKLRLVRPGPFNEAKTATLYYKNRKFKQSTPGATCKVIKEVGGQSLKQNYPAQSNLTVVDCSGKLPDVNTVHSVSGKTQDVGNDNNKRPRHGVLDAVSNNKARTDEKNRFIKGAKYNLSSKVIPNSHDVPDDISLHRGPLRAFQEKDDKTRINPIPSKGNNGNGAELNQSHISLISTPGDNNIILSPISLLDDNKSLRSNDNLETGNAQTPKQKMQRQNSFPYNFPALRGCKRNIANTCLPLATLRFDDGFLRPHDKDETHSFSVV